MIGAPPILRWQSTPVEPGSLWIAWRPRRWPHADFPWTDLALTTLGAEEDEGFGDLAGAAMEDMPPRGALVYCPPVPVELEEDRRSIAGRLLVAGCRLLYQQATGLEAKVPTFAPEMVTVLWDPLAQLLAGEEPTWPESPGGLAVWPLVPGLSSHPEGWPPTFAKLKDAGFATVQGLALDLAPAQRRRIAAALDEDAFDAVFHGAPGDERAFAQAAAAHGLAPFWPRPARGASREDGNRRIAAALAQVADLWLRLGRPAGQGQAFFQAARWVESVSYDLSSLIREGNLAVLTPLDESSRQVAAEAVLADGDGLLADLRSIYLAGVAPAPATATATPDETPVEDIPAEGKGSEEKE